MTVVICLGMWAIEILIAGEDDEEFASAMLKQGLKME